jgi:CheY-like chemotaxis protein
MDELKKTPVIILAEDDVGHAGLILSSLKDAGIKNDILCFETGEDTLNFLFKRGKEPHREEGVSYVLLLDIRLPGVDGTEVLRQVKKDKWVNNIPVIMLSVSDDPEEIEQCRRLGCDNYFVKQTTFKKFSMTIEQLGLYLNKVVFPEMAKA